MTTAPRRRAVVLTALGLEYTAVRAHLTDLRREIHPKGDVYEVGRFSGRSEWDVLVVEMGEGPTRAGVLASRAVEYFQPELALFVGVAGSLKPPPDGDVGLGDVVAATKVYNHQGGKAGTTFLARPVSYSANFRLEQLARALAREASPMDEGQ